MVEKLGSDKNFDFKYLKTSHLFLNDFVSIQ